MALTASAFLGTMLLQSVAMQTRQIANRNDIMISPIAKLFAFMIDMLSTAGIHLQSNLLAKCSTQMCRSDSDPLHVALSSVLGLSLIWTLGVSVGALK